MLDKGAGKVQKHRRIWAGGLAGIGSASLLGVGGIQAWSQQDNLRPLNGAIVGAKTAYVPLPVERVCGERCGDISVSPLATDALLFQTPVPPARVAEDLLKPEQAMLRLLEQGALEVNLLLWSSDSRRATTIWRGGGNFRAGTSAPMEVEWLTGTRIALLKVMVSSGMTPEQMTGADSELSNVKRTLTFVRINAGTGKTETLLTGLSQYDALLTSQTDPVAAVVSLDNGTLQRIDINGISGAPLKLIKPDGKKEFPIWLNWLLEGRTLRGIVFEPASAGSPAKQTFYRLDTITGVMTPEETAPKKTARPAPAPDAFPFVVHQGRDLLEREGVKTEVHPLWLEGRNKDTIGRTLIAADSDPNFKPVVLTSAILYRQGGTVYAIPLLKARAEQLAQWRQAQKAEAMRRAKQIAMGMLMYAEDYDGKLPPVGSDITQIEDRNLGSADKFNNPATGRNGFTTAYKAVSISSYDKPTETPLGYLAGPGGRVIIYVDGHVKWEDVSGG